MPNGCEVVSRKIAQKGAIDMGGEGLVSVRMPRSLLSVFRASAERQGYTIHKVAAELTCALTSLTLGELKSLREPPHEIENPRVTLNVTWGLIDILSDYTRDKVLTNSCLLYTSRCV